MAVAVSSAGAANLGDTFYTVASSVWFPGYTGSASG